MQTQTAKELMDRCARGPESAAWERFVERYGQAIEDGVRRALRRAGGARRRGGRRTASGAGRIGDLPADFQDDMVQECYCRLLEGGHRRLSGFRGYDEPEARAWLARLAERCTRDRLRAARAHKRGGRRLSTRLREAAAVADPFGSPERRAIGRQELTGFVRICHRFTRSPRDARVLRLIFLAGYTSGEVSQATRGELTPSSVDSLVHRFRRRLEADGVEVPRRG
jgi:RNA polymerase sigma factor (sigma-70 family)